jgi:hypothetical protein
MISKHNRKHYKIFHLRGMRTRSNRVCKGLFIKTFLDKIKNFY